MKQSERSSEVTCALDMNSGSLWALARLRMSNSQLDKKQSTQTSCSHNRHDVGPVNDK